MFWPFFFTLISSLSSLDINAQGVAESTKWKKLNYYQNQFLLPTSSFLVSTNPQTSSLESELDAFIRAAKTNPKLACQFPARYQFLVDNDLITTPIQYDHCPALAEYLHKVPVENFYYVYAAETITSVTSMMGHGFLMAEGHDHSGVKRQHSYSYFAQLNSLNPITLFYGAMVSGLNGKFSLHPYSKDLNQYLNKEQREVWSYQLNLNAAEIHELQLLLWELKEVDFTYRFHSFNCATLLLHALSIIKPQLADYEIMFVSPLDIAKALEEEGLVNDISVTLPSSLDKFHDHDQLIAYQHTKKPTLNPQDSMVSTYWQNDELHIALLPTSHLLRTPSSYRSSNNELRIGYIDYNISAQSLNELVLYGFKDYQATSTMNKSSEIYIGYKPTLASSPDMQERSFSFEYLLGMTIPINRVEISALAGLSYADQIAADTKINAAWSYQGNSAISVFMHNKKQKHTNHTLSGAEASLMLNGKYNLFVNHSKISGNKGKTAIGLDYHF